jgi:M6 family metalloprotease-like protein
MKTLNIPTTMIFVLSCGSWHAAYASPPPQDPSQTNAQSEAEATGLMPGSENYVVKRGFRTRVEAAKLVRDQKRRTEGPEMFGASPITLGGSVRGTVEVPVFPFIYAETAGAPFTATALEQNLYGTAQSQRSVTSHYQEMSGRRMTLSGVVRPWAVSSYSQAETLTLHPNYPNFRYKMGRTFHEVLQKSDNAVDFGRYDNDGPDGVPNSGDDDGVVDFVAFVHPNEGQECDQYSQPRKIWSHKWSLEHYPEGAFVTNDVSKRPGNPKIRVAEYVVQPAYSCKPGNMIEFGVFAHEYGHAFGLPDLYDTSGQTAGIGSWGLMGAGSWGGERLTPDKPIHMIALSKEYLGWLYPRTLTSDTQNVFLRPYAQTGDTIRIDYTSRYDPTDQSYLLVTYRKKEKFDDTLPGSGLLISEVNNISVNAGLNINRVNSVYGRHGIKIIEADGGLDLDSGQSVARRKHLFIPNENHGDLPSQVSQRLGATICNVKMNAEYVTFDILMDSISCNTIFGAPGDGMPDRTTPSVLENVLSDLIQSKEPADLERDVEALQ